MATNTPRIQNSARPAAPSTNPGFFNAFDGKGASSPTIEKAFDMSKQWLDNTVQQGRETAREAASSKGYYDTLTDSRKQAIDNTNSALSQSANSQASMAQGQKEGMQSNFAGGRLAFGGMGGSSAPPSNVANRATRMLEAQEAANSYKMKSSLDNYYATQNKNNDQSFQVQTTAADRAWQNQQQNEDREFQSKQSALDRAQQQKLAMLDSTTKLQSSMMQTFNAGSGGGYHFW